MDTRYIASRTRAPRSPQPVGKGRQAHCHRYIFFLFLFMILIIIIIEADDLNALPLLLAQSIGREGAALSLSWTQAGAGTGPRAVVKGDT